MKGGSGQEELDWDSYDKIKEQLELHQILQAEGEEKEKLMAIAGAEKFIQSWTKNIAKAAKEGGSGEEELDWDSYEKIKEEMGLDQSMNLMGWIESNPLTNFMETRELIRIRTLEALKDPKVKKKNAERIHSRHSNEQDLKKENQFVDEKEMTRRKRIGLANKGRVAWNKGREHTAETRELIRIRTLEAMKDPKVKKKIAEQIHSPRSDQTKARISYSQRRLWKERQKLKRARELFFLSWEQNIAKAAMKGGSGQEELDWDSYDKIKEQLKLHRILQAEGKEKEKLMAIVGEKFVQSWTKNIAKAAKEGGSGEEELDWDCYEKIKEKAKAKEIAKQLDHS